MTEPIAIIGMACRFPGARDVDSYWDLLVSGREAVGEPPRARPELEPPSWLVDQTPACRLGGYLDTVDRFEPGFFRISPREAARMDPQQRLLLEVAWEALEDAGQPVAPLAGTPTGVFVGVMNADFARRHAQDLARVDGQLGPGSSLGIASNRVSFMFDLRGPSMSVDTLCSSSLVAIHLACQSLATDESGPVAIAGGVNVMLDRTMDVFYARAGLLAADGRCRAFDASASGIVRGEGAGLLVLKRLSRARADGDRIRAVILGSAVNQDGRSNGLTSPSRWSQEEVLRAAYRRANVPAGSVSYVETHGTGTVIGDPIEAAALGAVMGEGRAADRPCAIGSVKTNLGHLESAAGVASLMKVVLSLSHRTRLPSLHFAAPNPYAKLADRNLRVSTRVEPWPDGGPRIAGVSSFGMGGTNAHLVIGGVDAARPRARAVSPPSLLTVSARTPAALAAWRGAIAARLADHDLADVAYSAGVRRDHHDHRQAIVAISAGGAALELERSAGASGRVVPGRTHTLVFVFGSRDDGEPADRSVLDRCAGSVEDSVARTFACQVELAAQLRSLGVVANEHVGIGTGAITAAYVSGSIDLDEAITRLSLGAPAGRLTVALGEDSTIIVEVGTRPMLQDELRRVLGDSTGAVLPSLGPDRASLLHTLAELYCLGVPLDWRRVGAPDARFVALGGYPWQRERCWLDFPGPTAAAARDVLVPTWTPSAPAVAGTAAGDWLVVSSDDETARAVASRLGARSVDADEPWEHVLAARSWRGVVVFHDGEAVAPRAAIAPAGDQLVRTLGLVQALARRSDDANPPRLWLVTRGGQVVAGDEALAPLARATVWGLGRVIANEHPRLQCTLVDLPAATSPGDADLLTAEILAGSDEREIALRDQGRFAGRLGRASLPPAGRLELRPKASYLITGGLGGLGLAAAQLLVARGARRLVLLGRRGVATDRARRAIAEMSGAGAAISVAAVDVADRDALAFVLGAHPIRGVIHAAGVMSPAMIAAIAPDDLRAMMAAKVDGALHLHELTSSLDFFVACSSVATLLGTPGQGAYAAANAYLDALAQHRRAIGLPATSIAWPVIEDTGMAADAGARAMRQLAERGLLSVSVRRATEALDQLLAMPDPPAHCGLATFDVQRWRAFYPRSAASPRLSPLYDAPLEAADRTDAPIEAAARTDAPIEAAARTEPPVAVAARAAQLRSLGRGPRLDAVEDYLRTVLADVLETREPVEPTRSLVDLGLDSMGALEVQEMVETQLEVGLATDRLLLGPTLRELAAEIATLLVPEDDARVAPARARASLRDDAVLDPDLTFAPAQAGPPSAILLTGATGFLGAFVLAELLAQTDAEIYCLVRAPTAADGLRRIEDALARHDLPASGLRSRVTCVAGDLAQPRFGLAEAAFARLGEAVDTIVHSGASVNFVFGYDALRAANVTGTREVLRLAASGRGARLHHVSTIGVFPGGRERAATIREDARADEPDRLALGYMRTKWVAEELVHQAAARGLSTTIFRPGTIAGHASTGAFNPDDFVCVMIKGCIELGAAPVVDAAVNLVPVDYVSGALVRVALVGAPGRYHLVGANVVAWTDLVRWLRELGYPLEELPYPAWRRLVLEHARAEARALVPLLPLFAEHKDTDWLHLPHYDDTTTRAALAGSGIACAPIDAALLRRYVERFVAAGYLRRAG